MLLYNFFNGGEETSVHPKIDEKILLRIGCIVAEVILHQLDMTLFTISIDIQKAEL